MTGCVLVIWSSGCPSGESAGPTGTKTTKTTTEETPIRLGPADDGRTITVETGQLVCIELPSNPSTGYEWEYDSAGMDGTVLEDELYRTATPKPGSPGTRRVLLEVNGSGRFEMVYRRPWETATPPERRFSVQFRVRDADTNTDDEAG